MYLYLKKKKILLYLIITEEPLKKKWKKYNGHWIDSVNFSKELTIGGIVYSCPFFQEVNSNGSFCVPKDCQSCLYFLTTMPKTLFFPTTVLGILSLLTSVPRSFSLLESWQVSTQWTVFLTQASSGKSMFSFCVNIFLTKTWFDDKPLSNPGAVFDFPPFWITSKDIFLQV